MAGYAAAAQVCVVIQNDVLSPRIHIALVTYSWSTQCATHTVSIADLIAIMPTLAVWHDPLISRPPQLECQN